MKHVDVLVVGAGVAGASLVYHLVRASRERGEGVGSVMLVERAPRAGAHASGRNARLVLQSVAEPLVRRLTAASARVYAERADEVGFERCGSLLLGARAEFAALRDDSVASEVLAADAVRTRVPWIAECDFEAALHTPGDGVLDPQRLLAFYLDGAHEGGVELAFGVEVTAIAGEGPFHVETSAGTIVAERLVNAAGAWAAQLGACAGAAPLPLVPHKRHLFLHSVELAPGLPYIWHLGWDVYFRRDAEGTLSCMCDEEPTAELAETVSDGAEERLRERLRPLAPALAAEPIARAWSCFRTKAPDALPVIGPDPRLPKLWWLAGLGGYGLGASWEVGRIAARAFIEGAETMPIEVLPSRF
ncbi:MAG TPA: FAD-dependent oxidoreductase [Thermoanaerobaculia bacterium]|nr:FAD-dependent oxidoreductase [Thermoanaerobaculia bacterium]